MGEAFGERTLIPDRSAAACSLFAAFTVFSSFDTGLMDSLGVSTACDLADPFGKIDGALTFRFNSSRSLAFILHHENQRPSAPRKPRNSLLHPSLNLLRVLFLCLPPLPRDLFTASQ